MCAAHLIKLLSSIFLLPVALAGELIRKMEKIKEGGNWENLREY